MKYVVEFDNIVWDTDGYDTSNADLMPYDELEVDFYDGDDGDEPQDKQSRIDQAIDELSEKRSFLIQGCRVHGVFGWGVFLRGQLMEKFTSRKAAAMHADATYDLDVYGDDVSIEELYDLGD